MPSISTTDTSAVATAARQQAAQAIYGLGATVIRRLPREVSLTAISTMATIDRSGPGRITDLALAQGVSQPSMTALVSGLERDGYVERRGDPADRRVAMVALTPDGVEALRVRRQAATASLVALVDQLSEAELEVLVAAAPVLDRLRVLDESQRHAHAQ